MELFILRHAIAVDHGDPGYPLDRDRPLTAEGKEKMRKAAKGMARLKLSFDLILSSPYVRTKQTAEIVANVLKLKNKIQFSDHLASEGGDPAKLMKELEKFSKTAKQVLLVGHEPYLSRLVSTLISGYPDCRILFKKAALCKLIVEHEIRHGECAYLEWFMTAKQMAKLK